MLSSRFLRFFLPITAVLAAILWAGYRQIESSRMRELRQAEEKYVALLGEVLADDFQAVMTDLKVLAYEGELRRALDAPGTAEYRQAATAFQRFAENKRVYDQIRYLDADGHEAVRVNYFNGQAQIVAQDQLQAKRDRYYFQETMRLAKDHVFVSAFDLNVEDGHIERPYKPTIRFSTPVFDSSGARRGILVLNYLGQMVLNRLARLDVDSPGQAMLLNADGYWLYDKAEGREWGFMFSGRGGDVFQNAYGPAWQQLQQEGQGQFRTADGLFTFDTVYPFRRQNSLEAAANAERASPSVNRRWYVVSLITSSMLSQYLFELRRGIWLLSLLLIAVVAGISWIMAIYATARERSERALRSSESRFRQMADSIAEVFWMSTTGRFDLLYVSPAFQTIWQADRLELEAIGRQWRNSIHPHDREHVLAVLDNLWQRESYSVQYRIMRSAGEPRWIWDQGFAVRDERGRIVRYAGIAEDITTLKTAQQKLLQSERLAAIGEAITGLAHESRNALQRSQSCLEMLAKRVADREEAANLVSRIQAALRDLHHLYERVRDYAAPQHMEVSPHDLRRIWQQACEDLADDIAKRGAVVTQSTDPAATTPTNTVCDVDAHAIRQVFRNIVENALSQDLDVAASRDQVKIDAAWSDVSWREMPAVQLLIRDNGPGFKNAASERIFEPFFTTKTRGTGLGMAICRRIVEAHGGLIEADSPPGQGLEIRIVLPKATP